MKNEKSVLKSAQFHAHLTKLCINGRILVPFGENNANLNAFVKYCEFFGVSVNGGAFANDMSGQWLYI